MGLTSKSAGIDIIGTEIKINKTSPNDKVIALCGNPNVGKSTIFNNLTGLNQHTGNWPGKTVANAMGNYKFENNNFILVDIPGTYSLMSSSAEEEIARDFICFGNPDATVIVMDATCIERNLNLVLQTLEITSKVVICVNLMDEAKRKGISVDLKKLSKKLGVPVVGTSAVKNKRLNELMSVVTKVSSKDNDSVFKINYDETIEKAISIVEDTLKEYTPLDINTRWLSLKLIDGDKTLLDSINNNIKYNIIQNKVVMTRVNEAKIFLKENNIDSNNLRDKIVSQIIKTSEDITSSVVSIKNKDYNSTDIKIDSYLTSKKFGIPIMLLLLSLVFWITITGANVPSELLATRLFWIEDQLSEFFVLIGAPPLIKGLLVDGMYNTLAWVVSVMLPPMAIFFPLFTLLEDLGYLPRVAFNLDNYFKKACTCGKQALTMCMGFGCNAAGVIGCRIIDSPRERLIAIITNNFVPCNGRFPTLIAIITMFFTGVLISPFKSIASAIMLTGVILLGIIMTLFISRILSKTILKGIPSSFTLELPPYRKPQVGKIIVRSIFDRTLFVLGRAVMVAAPAGIVIWTMANIQVDNISILTHCANFLNPFAQLIGLDGYILMAFILGFPANEIVVPLIIMSYMSTGAMLEFDSLDQLRILLLNNGWTPLTAICVMIFCLMHWPCATTCLTIKKETRSLKWTLASFAIPTAVGITICFIITSIAKILGLV